MNISFAQYLINKNLAFNTINSYLYTLKLFNKIYHKCFNKQNLQKFKGFLLAKYAASTINLRIRGINCYLEFINKKHLKLSSVKVQNKNFLENVISEADYEYFKKELKKHHLFWYFVIRFLAATGARVSELIQIKAEHVQLGYLDLYSKGGKIRRIYIPVKLQQEAILWLKQQGLSSGFIFRNRFGDRITPRGISGQLKQLAIKYKINTKVVYPHSFRHRFAKNFLAKYNDIALLADFMGHESIETTRIYLRKTSLEQRAIVDNIIDW